MSRSSSPAWQPTKIRGSPDEAAALSPYRPRMRRPSRSTVIACAATAAVTGAFMAPNSIAQRTIQEIFISNTPDKPVPTKAVGTTAVEVTNGSGKAIPVVVQGGSTGGGGGGTAAPNGKPWSRFVSITINPNSKSGGISVPLPSDGSLLITNVSVTNPSNSASGKLAAASLFTSCGGGENGAVIPIRPVNAGADVVANEPVRIATRPNECLLITVRTTQAATVVSQVTVALSGVETPDS